MNELRITRRLQTCLLLLITCLAFAHSSRPALAQAPDEQPDFGNQMLYLPLTVNSGESTAALEATRQQQPSPAVVKLLIDTDPGVDDAVALAWLVKQHEQPLQVLGIVSVAGNTTVANATNNTILMLEKLGRQDIPVVMGAAAPLVQPLSKTTWFIHGPDGLWFLGWQNPHDLSNIPNNAPAYYCSTVAANPGARVLALGPLTNIAQAVQQCPDTMKLVGNLVILGGAKYGGNKTPVTEFNFWQDPEAADIVFNAGLPITLVPLDAFTDPTVVQQDLDKLFAKATPAIQFLAPAIQQYADIQLASTGQAGIPDAVAAVIALYPEAGERQPALVKIVLAQSLARGQSVIGLDFSERIPMIASDAELSALAERAFANPPDPSFDPQQELAAILMRAADNAQVVTSAREDLLTKGVFPSLTSK